MATFAVILLSFAEVPRASAVLPGQIGNWGASGQSTVDKPRSSAIPTPTMHAAVPDEVVCLRAALDAARREGFPSEVVLAIGLTEAGRAIEHGPLTVWPWTVNSEGHGRFFPDKGSAIAWVRSERARGARSIDVGCMQVNLRWHPDAFPDLDTAFDPAANTAYAVRYLRTLRERHGSIDAAVGRYHSPTPWRQKAYRERVDKNTAFAAAAQSYLSAVARSRTASAARSLVWGERLGGGAVFNHGLFADNPPQPILPSFHEDRGASKIRP